ncbi:30S ribosomal protein S2 [Candidatus Gottesmanbacteria bacterium RBG_13_45_10]|uniref:Small ribosomal subunit protein uS2 n=1 Tax=Candidatus Gottesmanbacteria bacterium RBG_13_45_10 TaxID=1798370 RepID=A0A1F5ZGR5_9BACT|nr:MAG: 30S ribosomal protein S2 [Candidatus Gottesmanbacteria bacterium RBG_13_45_10]
MQEITLQALLEAGCHFGHKAERWHPKAAQFIYTEKDGIHIIDLVKTQAGLEAAMEYVKSVATRGDEVLFVGTKRQAQGIVKQEAEAAGAAYLVARWIGGFLTNWDQIHKNIEKINRLAQELQSGAWKKFPKHEQSKLARYLERIKVYYGGVLHLNAVPAALFVVDIKKEIAAVREGIRRGVPIIAIVDTNSDPTGIDYVIPANDDAVGSISYIVQAIAHAFKEGKEHKAKEDEKEAAKKVEPAKASTETSVAVELKEKPAVVPESKKAKVEEKPKRERKTSAEK